MYRVFLVLTFITFCFFTLLTLISCSSSLPNTALDKSYRFSEKQTIATYVTPTGNAERDDSYSRVLYLDLQARGYKVIDANRLLSKHSETISGKDHSQIANSLRSNKIIPPADVYVIVQPSWDSAYVLSYYSESRSLYWIYYQFAGMYVPTLKSQVSFFDSGITEPIKSYIASDTTYIYSENEDSQLLFPEYPWMTIAKQLSRELDDIPICSIPNSPPGVDNIPINLWVDNSYREAFPDSWKDRLRLRILYVNDIFRPQFNVDFTIAKFIEWNSKFYRELDNTLDKLHSSVASNSSELDIGITLNKELQRNWKTRKELGFAYLLSNNAVITAQPSYPSVGQNWNSIEEAITLAHEIGHIFGAIHVPDRNSIMYSSSGYMSFEFDELNKQIITVTKENFLNKSDSERLITYSGELVKLKNYPTSNSTAILNPISSVVVQIDQRKKILSKDSDKTFNNLSKLLPDSVTILAVMGYLELKENNSDGAINLFTKVFNMDPKYVEAQYYLSLALKKNGENEEAVIYEEMYKPYRKLWILE